MKRRLVIYGVNFFPPKGGTSRVVENLILQLKDEFDITIYCYRTPRAKTHIAGVKTVEFRQWAKGSPGSLIYFFCSAVHLLLFGKADLVHAHKTDCALFIPLLKLRFKVIATSHEAPYKRDKWNYLQRTYFRLAERVFVSSADVCTCISKPLSDYYETKYKRKVYFIPNGINVTERKDFDEAAARGFLPGPASLDRPYILFSARRLMSTKGCHTMLEALRAINYEGQVFITGELEETAYLQKLKRLSTGLNVFFLGYVDPLNALLGLVSRAGLFIFPSETEGMSVMLMEVASVGVPIIASDIPENTQVFSPEEVSYFQTGNAADLAGKIKRALDEPARMEIFGAAARKLVITNYLWKDICQKYSEIYRIV
ncbi:glycosyltransferase family 4 protein [Mucilaginibacter corticis]|uniref:Glycosyltransferase family 4 protein n=1 Tax=Mucilaginibacter corticis TaxID=2597670 RepID=A0A556MMA5_9SPHI|nr:glycosyltransferase family 4 protein [Mucilaginibacter corticis]TSJ40988.1 glycosyltransferase family 4 protein [Mucilaginibacter corticis]